MAKFLTDAGVTTLVSKIKEQIKSVKNIADNNTTEISTLKSDVSKIKSDVSSSQSKLIKTTITLNVGWTKDTDLDYYIQNIPIAGITKNTVAIVDVATDGRHSWWIGVWNADWQKIIGAETYDGGIKFIASEPFERNDVMVQVIAIN